MKYCLFFLVFLMTSCGYRSGSSSNNRLTLTVPYVEGDFYGIFTDELIKQIGVSNSIIYSNLRSDYKLVVSIVKKSVDQIGYKYDRDIYDGLKKNLRATEGRLTVTAKVQLLEKKTDKVVLGPFTITADSEFDYVDPDSLNDLSFIDPVTKQRVTNLAYSLGQLESIESAKEATMFPLYVSLSKKIVDAISAYW